MTVHRFASNFVGHIAVVGFSFVSVPLFIRWLVDPDGVIGFFISVQVLLSMMDLGIGTALTREVSNPAGRSGELGAVIRWVERAYLIYAIVLIPVSFILAWIALRYWLNAPTIPFWGKVWYADSSAWQHLRGAWPLLAITESCEVPERRFR